MIGLLDWQSRGRGKGCRRSLPQFNLREHRIDPGDQVVKSLAHVSSRTVFFCHGIGDVFIIDYDVNECILEEIKNRAVKKI